MTTGKFISYLRVSTNKQGLSGLGLEAQRADIETYLNGGDWQLLREFVEVESGKNDNRPKLQAALSACQTTGSTLVIAKLDRLSRDAHFLLGLQKANVKFIAVDMPQANELTVGIMALVAQEERKAISQRTKAALTAAKARGVQLGNPDNLKSEHAQKGRAMGTAAIKEKASVFAERMSPIINEYLEQGLSLNAVARQLNADGVLTARGKDGSWTARTVKNVIEKVKL